jgi:hypothetical protein|tara:strand:- start:295 stop:450 length:156 start_codon:yes stop_codon:yes gene_type:complete
MNKSWYKSKSVWAALIMGLVGAAEAAGIAIPEYAFTLLAGFGLYGVRSAIK